MVLTGGVALRDTEVAWKSGRLGGPKRDTPQGGVPFCFYMGASAFCLRRMRVALKRGLAAISSSTFSI